MQILALKLAGIILLCIVLANFFAPKKMRWIENLDKTENLFRQVFIVHCLYLIGCVLGMALVCLFLPHLLLQEVMGKILLIFMAVFWLTRIFVNLFYYETAIKKQFPFFNILFSTVYIYLGLCFSVLSWMCWFM